MTNKLFSGHSSVRGHGLGSLVGVITQMNRVCCWVAHTLHTDCLLPGGCVKKKTAQIANFCASSLIGSCRCQQRELLDLGCRNCCQPRAAPGLGTAGTAGCAGQRAELLTPPSSIEEQSHVIKEMSLRTTGSTNFLLCMLRKEITELSAIEMMLKSTE